jgi:hypothetical protein
MDAPPLPVGSEEGDLLDEKSNTQGPLLCLTNAIVLCEMRKLYCLCLTGPASDQEMIVKVMTLISPTTAITVASKPD